MRCNPLLGLFALFTILVTDVVSAQATGTLQGRVTAETGGALEGVQVRIPGTSLSASTDVSGLYLIRGVPAGATTIEFDYLGTAPRSETVTVAADTTTRLDLRFGAAVLLEQITVRSQSEAQSAALNLYRSSDAITNITAADEIGSFVDQNVAEALQRLPGISITRDQGEGRFVTIRGLNSNLNNVSLNGMRIGTPEDGNRELPLDLIPTGSVDRLEVIKVPTPDMPGDAIGGSVNVVSPSAFDQDGQVLRYRVEGLYAELGDETGGRAELAWSNVFDAFGGNDTLGVSFGVNYLERNFQSNNLEAEYDLLEELASGGERFAPIETQQRKYFIKRDRLGANLNLDFRPSFRDKYFFNFLYSQFNDAETRQRSINVFEDGNLTSIQGGTANFEGIEADGIRRRVRFRSKEQETFAFGLGGEHRLEKWTIDYRAGYSEASEKAPDEIEGRFELDGDDVDGSISFGNGVPRFLLTRGGQPAADVFSNENFALDRVVLESTFVDEDDLNFNLNFERDFMFGNGSRMALKFGGDARFKNKDVDANETELRSVPDIFLDLFSRSGFSFPYGSMGDGVSSRAFRRFFAENRAEFDERPRDVEENLLLSAVGDFKSQEDVLATYLMGTLDIGEWRLIAGARYEDTDFSTRGNAIDFDENGDLSGIRPVRASNSYGELLPGFHAHYKGFDDIVIRAAWTNTLARPSFADLSPGVIILREDLEVEAGNPNLDPITSSNLDLMVDWYMSHAGILSVGLFYKDIDNFVVDFVTDNDLEFPGFEVERPINGSAGEVRGIELNWQQSLGLWNPVLEGFLAGANYTWMDTEFSARERPGESFALPQASETIANLYLGYERGPLSARISYAARGKYLDEIGDDDRFDVFVDDHGQLDLTASWRLVPQAELLLEVTNITDEPLRLYQGAPGNLFQIEKYGTSFALGLRGRF